LRHFIEELEELQARLLEMGTIVESAIHHAVLALMERSEELARQVLRNEDRINHLEVEIDELAVRLLALGAGIKIELLATGFARELLQMIHQRLADALRTSALIRNEVVDIHLDAVDGVLVDPMHRDADDIAVAYRDAHARAVGKNTAHLAGIVVRQMRTELAMHGLRFGEPIRLDDGSRRVVEIDDTDARGKHSTGDDHEALRSDLHRTHRR